jgi:serine/threonine protein kinase
MGVVYKARDPRINRIVAVKTISLAGQAPEDELDYRERFFREAEAAGRISHPGIVTIFDVGEEPETRAPYIVMEFVNGESLDKILFKDADRKLPVETALRLTLELADALDCAHRQGVVHRDLKPANILVTEDGHAKIADFGVAKLNLSNQTLAGRALGTPAYMSPEQLNGEAVDGRSDLFSPFRLRWSTTSPCRRLSSIRRYPRASTPSSRAPWPKIPLTDIRAAWRWWPISGNSRKNESREARDSTRVRPWSATLPKSARKTTWRQPSPNRLLPSRFVT